MDKKNKGIIERFLEFLSQIVYAFSFYADEIKKRIFGDKEKEKKKQEESKRRSNSQSARRDERARSSSNSSRSTTSKREKSTTVRQVNIEDILEAIEEEQRLQNRKQNSSNIYDVSQKRSNITDISLEDIRERRQTEQRRREGEQQRKTELIYKEQPKKAEPARRQEAAKPDVPKREEKKTESVWLRKQVESLEELKKKRQEERKKRQEKKPTADRKESKRDVDLESKRDTQDAKDSSQEAKSYERPTALTEQDEKLAQLKKMQEEQLELVRKRQQEQKKAQEKEQQKRLEYEELRNRQQEQKKAQEKEQQKRQEYEELRRRQQEQNRLQAEERRKKEAAQLEEKLKKQEDLKHLQEKEWQEIEALKREKEQAQLELLRISQQEEEQLKILKEKQEEQERLEKLRSVHVSSEEKSANLEEKNAKEKAVAKREPLRRKESSEKSSGLKDVVAVLKSKARKLLESRKEHLDEKAEKRDFGWVKSGTIAALVVIVLMVGGSFLGKKFSANVDTKSSVSEENDNGAVDSVKESSVTLSFVGDVLCHGPQFQDAYDVKTGVYDFSKCLSLVKPYLESADLTIGNLETVFAGKEQRYTGHPTFNTPDEMASALKDAGFDILTTANNHSFDRGEIGVTRTLDVLDQVGISHMGTYRNEQEKQNIVIKEVNGIKFAFVSFTTFVNQNTTNGDSHINYLTEQEVNSQMQLAKAQNPDCIVAMPHWGVAYETLPNATQLAQADLLINAGADIIVGSHPHVIQKMGKKKTTGEDGTTREVFIAYSLGNFISNQNSEYTRDEVLLNLTVKKGANGVYIDNIGYRPLYMYKDGSGINTRNFQVIDIATYKKNFTQNGDENAQNLYNTVQGAEEHIKMLLRGEADADENAQEIESSAQKNETTTSASSTATAASSVTTSASSTATSGQATTASAAAR